MGENEVFELHHGSIASIENIQRVDDDQSFNQTRFFQQEANNSNAGLKMNADILIEYNSDENQFGLKEP